MTATGLSGIVCSNCEASLWQVRWTWAVAVAFPFVLAEALRHVLRHYGRWNFTGRVAAIALLVGSFLLLLEFFVRLREKKPEGVALNLLKKS